MFQDLRSDRLKNLPPYLFAELDIKKRKLLDSGVDVINLGIGDPDIPPPTKMIEVLKEALDRPEFHRYPSYNGADFFRKRVAEWLSEKHKVAVDMDEELLALIGSKEGLSHLPQSILNAGDTVLITDPCYPVHLQSMLLAGVNPEIVPLTEENNFLPDLDRISGDLFDKAKLFVINYPNNPTSAVATRDFFEKLVKLAHKHNFIICQDAAYIDICLDDRPQPALLSIDGAKEVSVEFFSFSKMFNACGWRLGFCAGNKSVIAALGKYKTAIDSGQFTALQWAASVALKECYKEIDKTLDEYRKRKKTLVNGLAEMNLECFNSNSTFYVWSKVPNKFTSQQYANHLLDKKGIVATPGIGFGQMGDSYIRFALTSPMERLQLATGRMKAED